VIQNPANMRIRYFYTEPDPPIGKISFVLINVQEHYLQQENHHKFYLFAQFEQTGFSVFLGAKQATIWDELIIGEQKTEQISNINTNTCQHE